MVIGIIGGGASGMTAAITAAEQPDVQVLLFERQVRVGKKLHATGNGRCNLSNIHAEVSYYHGEEPNFVIPALTALNSEATLSWFRNLGLFTVVEDSGKVYPYSDQANSVVDILRLALNKPNLQLYTDFDVKKLVREKDGFLVVGDNRSIACDKIIVACGGLAGTKLGGNMSGYKLLAGFGHKSTRLRPTLVQLKSDWSGTASLKGVRTNCHACILHNGEVYSESIGELQFTEYGVSGPVIFEISRDVCQEKGKWSCKMDFIPQCSKEQLIQELLRRKETNLQMDELLTGILHNRLGRVMTKAAGVKGKQYVKELSNTELYQVCNMAKNFEIFLTEPMGMEAAQVTAGGVRTRDFNADTMESKLVTGLYACGEVLDIDGDCGGYNLQWAWSSGYCAGFHAGKSTK